MLLTKSKQVRKKLFISRYKFVSFHVILLFTKISFAKTIDMILERVYSDKIMIKYANK